MDQERRHAGGGEAHRTGGVAQERQ